MAKKIQEMLSEKEEYLAKEIVDCAFKVHKQLGPGLLEKVYEICFCHELGKKKLNIKDKLIFQLFMITWFLMKD